MCFLTVVLSAVRRAVLEKRAGALRLTHGMAYHKARPSSPRPEGFGIISTTRALVVVPNPAQPAPTIQTFVRLSYNSRSTPLLRER